MDLNWALVTSHLSVNSPCCSPSSRVSSRSQASALEGPHFRVRQAHPRLWRPSRAPAPPCASQAAQSLSPSRVQSARHRHPRMHAAIRPEVSSKTKQLVATLSASVPASALRRSKSAKTCSTWRQLNPFSPAHMLVLAAVALAAHGRAILVFLPCGRRCFLLRPGTELRHCLLRLGLILGLLLPECQLLAEALNGHRTRTRTLIVLCPYCG